jgi:hypothetical protein
MSALDDDLHNLIERNNADNLRRMKKWLKFIFKDEMKYPDVFNQEMDIIIEAAKELKKEMK